MAGGRLEGTELVKRWQASGHIYHALENLSYG